MPFALVTGASRCVGRGVAAELAAQGFIVFATGRSIATADLPPSIVRIKCDLTLDGEIERVFHQIDESCAGLDVLVNSAWGGYERMAAQKYVGNSIYGIAKAATDKMSSDMAYELRQHSVAVVSLYPGLVRTEAVMEAAKGGWLDVSNSESSEFIGRVISTLAHDPKLMERSGRALVAAEIAQEFGVVDIDGRQPAPLTLASV